jgi:hypothetical protein
MPRYLVSFDDGSMDHISETDLPSLGEAAHAVVREAKAAGVWIFGGGVQHQQSTIVDADCGMTFGPVPEIKAVVGGFSIIEARKHNEACNGAQDSPEPVGVRKKSERSCSTQNHSHRHGQLVRQ